MAAMEQPNSTVEVVLVATNQEGELEGVVRRLHRALPARAGDAWRLTIVDHASSDATLAVARRLSEELDHVRAVHLAERLDGRALRARWAGSSAGVVALAEADADTDIEQLPA